MSDTFPCTRCGDQITDGYMIGDGDGMGQRFAHPECYREYPGAYKHRQVFEVELAAEKAAHARTQEWLDRFQGEVSAKIIEIDRLKKALNTTAGLGLISYHVCAGIERGHVGLARHCEQLGCKFLKLDLENIAGPITWLDD